MKTLTQRTLSRASSINSYERIIYLLNQIYYFMKLNKILMVLAATAIVGCTSDDLNDLTANQAVEDSRLIELDPNFVLAGVGEGGVATRTHWEQDAETKGLVNKFLPIWNDAPAANNLLSVDANLEAQAVGLCWLGQTPGAEVYTNYQFFHYGWLKKGETEADVDNCTPFKLYNGALYDEITHTDAGTANGEADETKFTLPSTPIDKSAWELNWNSGVYQTKNKTIFGGQYIVYFPYNPDFQETGTIPAVATTSFDWDINEYAAKPWENPMLGEATFRYSAPVTIDGGMKAANFGLYNLSTLVRLRVFTATAGDPYNNDEIDKVVLYSPSGKFVKQANLGADKIAAGETGAKLYAETEGTKTITTNFITTATSLNVKATTTVSAYLTVLPTTVDDLVALVHNKDIDKWYRVEMPTTEFKAGNGQVVDITVKESDITSDFVAVDDASLRAALTSAESVASESNPVTITLIGDVKMTNVPSALNINQDADRYITIDGGDIIVPQDVTLTLTSLKEMKSTVRVLGKSCCDGTLGGRLVVTGTDADKDATILNNITLEETEARVSNDTEYDNYNPMVTYEGAAKITIADDAKVTVEGGNVVVNKPVQHKGDIEIKEDAKVTVNAGGDLSFLGSTVDNYGIIEVKKAGEFYLKNSNGTSVWTDGQNMTNHATGKFIHNVDAVVGNAVQYMNQETGSEYRCRVDKQKALDDAYVQWTACNVIEMVNADTPVDQNYDLGNACQHTIWGSLKHVDIEVNNTGKNVTFNDTPSDGKSIQIGNLTVNTPLVVDYKQKSSTDKTQRQLTVNGDMTVSANATLTESKKVTVTGNLDIVKDETAVKLTYAGDKKIVEGLAVGGNITVTDATFDASADGGILISCTNFSLIKEDPAGTGAAATFGNRTAGDTANKTMEVKGTISNAKGCTFTISPAAGGNLLAWITCYKTEGEGTYAGTPAVVQPAE